jgi:hypothetical protein
MTSQQKFSKISLLPYYGGQSILAKMTVKNQITLPKAVTKSFPGVEYFEVSSDGTSITLRPLRPNRADEARARLAAMGITEQDVEDAIAWARGKA